MIGGPNVNLMGYPKQAALSREDEGRGGELVSSPSYLEQRLSELVLQATRLRRAFPRDRVAVFNIQMAIDSAKLALGHRLFDIQIGANVPIHKNEAA